MRLEIGCGGNKEYEHATFGDVNVDIRPPTKKTVNFILAEAHNLPFKSDSFEKVHVHHLIEHLGSPQQALEDCHRILKAGGEILVETPNALFILKVLRAMKRGFYTVDKDHIATYGYPEITHLLERAGYKDINVIYSHAEIANASLLLVSIVKLCPFKALKNIHLIAIAHK